MITFNKVNNKGIPEILENRVITWTNDEVIIDDTGLTPAQILLLKYWMYEHGYKAQ